MPASYSTRQYKCTQCGRHYSNASHLRRHEATHSSRLQTVCPFCNRRFLRSDVLRRHSRTCRHKSNHSVLPERKRGRKRKACDSCAQSRTVCDGESPCETCLAKRLDCSYNRMQRVNDSCISPQEACGSMIHTSATVGSGHPYVSRSQKIPISFLLNYTDPIPKSSYDFHRFLFRHSNNIPGPTGAMKSHPNTQNPNIESWPSIFHAFINTSALGISCEDTDLPYGCDDIEKLPVTIDQLLMRLKQHQTSDMKNTELDVAKAKIFFSPTNLHRFVNSFFENSADGDRFIHKASFNVNTASTALLSAVLLLGATCASPSDAVVAEEYATLVEYSVFEDVEFRQLLYHDRNPQQSKENIELVQAAVLILSLQGSRDRVEVKRRMRIQRFPSLVSVARSLNLTQVINNNPLNGRDLGDYIHKETLVRTMSWLYLCDCHFVVFYRCPPQFKILEAGFGLPQHDEVFHTTDPLNLESIICQIKAQPPPISLKSVVQLLMHKGPVQIEEVLLQTNTLFALFLILSALQEILSDLLSIASCYTDMELFQPIERALDRWKTLWDSFHTYHESMEASKSGYMMHGIEFWWLAKTLVRQSDLICNKDGFAFDSMDLFHEMLKYLSSGDADSQLEI